MPTRSLLLPLLLMASCGGPPAPTPASEAVAALVAEIEERVAGLSDEALLEAGGRAALFDYVPTGWAHPFLEMTNMFDPVWDAETVVILLVIADLCVDGGKAQRGAWRVNPVAESGPWVELRHDSGSAYRAKIEQNELGWRCTQFDPVLPSLAPEDDSAEAYAMAAVRRLMEIEQALPAISPRDEEWKDSWSLYTSWAGNSMGREFGFTPENGMVHPEFFQVMLVDANWWYGRWRVGVERGWQQSLEIARVELEDEDFVRLLVRMVQRDERGDLLSPIFLEVFVARENGSWDLWDMPQIDLPQSNFEFQFNASDGHWHYVPESQR